MVDDTLFLVSGTEHSDWRENLLANSSVEVHIEGNARSGIARLVTEADERRLFGDVMAAKYDWEGDPGIGLTRHAWCYEVPGVAISNWR